MQETIEKLRGDEADTDTVKKLLYEHLAILAELEEKVSETQILEFSKEIRETASLISML